MQNVVVLNRKYEVIGIVDDYSSLIWTERYYQYSDFEIETSATKEHLEIYVRGNYIHKKDSDRLMIIDSIEYNSSAEEGRTLLVSGKDLTYLLFRRIIWKDTVLNEYGEDEDEETHVNIPLVEGIRTILNENVVSPSKANRKIPEIQIGSFSSEVSSISMKGEHQYSFDDNVYDVTEELATLHHIGFAITFTSDGVFTFKLYRGVDRSYGQTSNQVVVFSPEFGNIISSKKFDTFENYANAALVAGEKRTESKVVDDVTQSRDIQYTVELEGSETGIDRFEVYIDQTSLKMYINDVEVPPDKYKNRLKINGEEELAKKKKQSVIEAELDYNGQFKYGKDYFLGDIVEVEDDLQRTTKVRIVEVVHCHDLTGDHVNPGFIDLSEEED